ncbi:MAG: hypothetical protein M3N04_06915 [Actinomycetota bacterium]|nr:hypothetical protein [Actinomycetota bacterium]
MQTVNRQFLRHYAEMVVVMFVGMAVLGLPAGWALKAAGSSWAQLSPAPMLLLMAFTMTVPMVAWMQRMGHDWRPTTEMAASMIVPTLGVVALFETAVVEDVTALLIIEHVAMLAGMFGVMLLRPEEYSHHKAAEHQPAHPAVAHEAAA